MDEEKNYIWEDASKIGNQYKKMNGSRWMEKNYIWEDASIIGNQYGRKWTAVDGWRKITFVKTHLKSGNGLGESERQSMDEENDFCFGSEKTEDQLRGSVKRK